MEILILGLFFVFCLYFTSLLSVEGRLKYGEEEDDMWIYSCGELWQSLMAFNKHFQFFFFWAHDRSTSLCPLGQHIAISLALANDTCRHDTWYFQAESKNQLIYSFPTYARIMETHGKIKLSPTWISEDLGRIESFCWHIISDKLFFVVVSHWDFGIVIVANPNLFGLIQKLRSING